MGKNLSMLAGLVAAVLAFVGAGAYWVGAELLNLAMFDSRRNEPYALLDFARGQQPAVHRVRYRAPLAGLVASEGGELLAGYQLSHLVEGEHSDEWTYVSRVYMSRGLDLVQVMTSSPYRVMHNDLSGLQTVQLGSFTQPAPDWRAALAVWLVEVAAKDPLKPVSDELSSGDGRVVWDTSVTPLSADMSWDRVFIVDFATEQDAFEWLRRVDVATARALANARAKKLALAVYVR